MKTEAVERAEEVKEKLALDVEKLKLEEVDKQI